jgi:hypothetical protein
MDRRTEVSARRIDFLIWRLSAIIGPPYILQETTGGILGDCCQDYKIKRKLNSCIDIYSKQFKRLAMIW